MSPSPFSDPAAIAERLRAAGCVFAEDEAELLVAAAADPGSLAAMVERRVTGHPLEHLLGWANFAGLRVAVTPGVFVPRPRTEFLVDEAVALARALGRPPVVVDLCCGSGAVGAALAAALPGLELHAADLDPVAVRCARRNLPGAYVHEGDLYEPLPSTLRGRIDLLVVNAPYVPTDAIGMLPPEARLYEPLLALDGGADGLDIQRRVAADAAAWLAPGGHLLIETSERQAPQTLGAFAAHGLTPRLAASDDFHATVAIGRRTS